MQWSAKMSISRFRLAGAPSDNTPCRSTVTHASMRDSIRSITRNNASTYSTKDSLHRRTAAAASLSERSSGFIIDIHRNGPQFFDLFRKLLDFGLQLVNLRFTEFFLSSFLKVHSLSMVP